MNVLDIIPVTDAHLNGIMYNGSKKKFGVTIDGVNYIMKFRKRDWNNLESEYIASNVIKIFGGNVHDVYLGEYKGERVVLCRDFTDVRHSLKSFKVNESVTLDTDLQRHDYSFSEVVHCLSKLDRCNHYRVIEDFKVMFLFDALLGNPDRHAGKWGVLKSVEEYKFSPIFDNGADLFPRALAEVINVDWIKTRVYDFPNSKIMFDNRRERSSYVKVISEHSDLFFNTLSLFTEDKLEIAFTFIENTPLSDYLKVLYKTVLYYRFHCIIKQKPWFWEGLK